MIGGWRVQQVRRRGRRNVASGCFFGWWRLVSFEWFLVERLLQVAGVEKAGFSFVVIGWFGVVPVELSVVVLR